MASNSRDDVLTPLAVVGLSLKFPEDATSPEAFWDMLVQGRCASSEFPASRINIDAHHHQDRNRLDSISLRNGHFLKEDLGAFDAPFFGISASEAESLDPQQRLALETVYRAFENAGLPPEHIAGSKTSVIAGSFCDDYHLLQVKDPLNIGKHIATGSGRNMISNRLSWFFDLRGPSMTLDTACSSSLVALDMACQSIWGGDATMGLALGSNVILAPEMTIGLDNLGLLGRDGRSYSFDDRANGYARGEGIGAIVIRPLEDAVKNGDTIRAVIRASSSNQDGKTPGILQPSKDAQLRLIRDTYEKAGLDMATTRYFEAHGTGTPVGDPIETRAIGTAFRKHRSKEDPLYIGSVKSNIGHLEGASGIAGVIKVILSLEKGIIPPNSENLESLNPQIDEEFLNLKALKDAIPWPSDGLRRASVSSFGFGGANCHVVLDDAYNSLRLRGLKTGRHSTSSSPSLLPHHNDGSSLVSVKTNGVVEAAPMANGTSCNCDNHNEPSKLLVWSSSDENGIKRIAESWNAYLKKLTIPNLEKESLIQNLAYTLSTRRSHLKWRTFAVAEPCPTLEHLTDQLSPAIRSITSPHLAFVFTGQGAQWHAMGKELIDQYDVFKKSLLESGEYLKTLGCAWDIFDELRKPKSDSNVNDPSYGQPLCTALQTGLVDLLHAWSIRPAAVVGHSSGEIAAAYSTGSLSKQSALKVAYFRGCLAGKLGQVSKTRGSMIAVGLSKAETLIYFDQIEKERHALRLVIACVNSPKSVTVSGDEEQINILHDLLDQNQVFSRKLVVNVAYHSFQMEEIACDYEGAIGKLEEQHPQDRKRPPLMFSSVTGGLINQDALIDPGYWVKNMISPVLFADALEEMCSHPANIAKKIDGSHRRSVAINHLLEIGPHSALQGPCRDTLNTINKNQDITYIPFLRRNHSAARCALEAAGRLHCSGYSVNLSLVNRLESGLCSPQVLVDLPEYPFDHSTSYWLESRKSKGYRLRNFGRLDLLGIPDPDGNPMEAHWRNIIKVSEMPWIQDHKINNAILYPAAGMVIMAIESIKQLADQSRAVSGFTLKDCKFPSAIHIPTHAQGIETNVHMKRVKDGKTDTTGWYEFRICVYDNDTWVENCTGSIQASYASKESGLDTKGREEAQWLSSLVKKYNTANESCATSIDPQTFYKDLTKFGYQYGPAFAAITGLNRSVANSHELVSDVRTFQESPQPHTIHPTTLDAIIHLMTAMVKEIEGQMKSVAVPTRIEQLWLSNAGGLSYPDAESLRVHASSDGSSVADARYSMVAFDKDITKALLTVDGLSVTNIANAEESLPEDDILAKNLCHYVQLKPDMDLLSNEEINAFCLDINQPSSDPVESFVNLDFLVAASVSKVPASVLKQARQNATPHMLKYIDWIVDQQELLSSGQSMFSSEGWIRCMQNEAYINKTQERVEKGTKRGLLTSTVCKNLIGFITGDTDPVSLLFEGNLLNDAYFEMVFDLPKIESFARFLDTLAHKNPQMNVIELGAGSGSMTEFCMKTLARNGEGASNVPRYTQWDFTDISGSFFPHAQDVFSNQGDRMRFMALDIEEDPGSQGFENGTYDMVVAFLVLHATQDLSVSLKNARKLLKPGGKFLLFEITRPGAIRTTFVFGLFDGWWRGTESYRQKNPCVDEEKWGQLLQQAGFSGCDIVMNDYDDERCHETSMIVSTAVVDSPTPTQTGINIVLDPSSPEHADMASKLRRNFASIGVDNVRQGSIQEILSTRASRESLDISLLEIQDPFLDSIDRDDFEPFRDLIAGSKTLLWVNGGGGHKPCPKFRLADGLLRVVSDENQNARLSILSLEQSSTADHQAEQITKTVLSIMAAPDHNSDTEHTEIDGILHISRLVPANTLNQEVSTRKLPQQTAIREFGAGPPLRLKVGSAGLLNTLHFVEDKSLRSPLKSNEIEVQAKAVGLNFRDVLIALGRLNSDTLGGEFAGIVTQVGDSCRKFQPGDRVVVYHPSHYANYVRVNEDMAVIKLPNEELSFVDAAAIPIAFGTAWLTLHQIARLQAGESVLIHSGAGGTGQAAIRVAQYVGATIFTTVSSESKKRFLMEQYDIPEEHIFSSRNTLFAKGIRRLTDGVGVDVVLNSLASDELIASWECVAPYGRFVEIGKNDILSNSKLPMHQFEKNVSFSAFDLAAMTVDRPRVVVSALEEVFSLVRQGKLSLPDSVHVFGISEIEHAFRQMQSGRNMGKAVMELRDEDKVTTVLDTKPGFTFEANASYVIAGGLGGLGRSLAKWFVERGARNLILLSRSGGGNAHAGELVADLQAKGATVVTPACDITNRASLEAVLGSCSQHMPPVKGCVQATMVVSNSHFEQLSLDSWRASTTPKAQGSWNLHEVLPTGMDFFVLMSSVAGVIGARGESGYAAGNTFLDGLARYRIGIGEKAVSLDLGLFLSAGFFNDNEEAREKFLQNTVLHPISESDLHALLDIYCNPSLEQISIEKSQTVVGILPKVREKGMNTTDWMQRPVFSHVALVDGQGPSAKSDAAANTNFAAVFASAASLNDVTGVVMREMRGKLSRMLSISNDEIDLDRPIHQYGVDSLAAVELRNWFGRELRADIAIFDILGGASVASVVALAVGKSEYGVKYSKK